MKRVDLTTVDRNRRYRIRNREGGRCFQCPALVASGRSRCPVHLAKQRDDYTARTRYGLPAPLVRELGLNTDRRTHADR